jgi:T5SS/PEP-CTERM-associated repeat protein
MALNLSGLWFRSLLAASEVLLFSGAVASAQTTAWATNNSGDFYDAGNWTSGVPLVNAGRFARGTGVAYSVSVPIAGETVAPVGPLSFGSNEVTFTSTLPTHFSVAGGSGEDNRGLIVGKDAGDDAVLNMDLYRFHTRAATLGDAAGSRGVINLSKLDATLMVYGNEVSGAPEFIVGRYGTGILNVSSGGWAHIYQQFANATLGLYAGSEGTANIIGPNANMYVGSNITVGDLGRGVINIAEGGVLQAQRNTVIGARAGSVGEVNVAGGVWDNHFDIEIGSFGRGQLSIEDGGFVQSREGDIGFFGASEGSVTVDGADSLWLVAFTLQVGLKGTGKLSVTNGGAVEAVRIDVGSLGDVSGDGVLTGDVVNRGVVAPGNELGALTIEGSYEQLATGRLLLELGSIDEYDQLNVTGAAELAGRLSIEAEPGFVPTAGQTFDVMDFTSVSGVFDAVELPALPEGLTWNTSQLYSTGSVSIAPGFSSDFDGDGDVDGADFTQWQGDFGANDLSDADDDGDSDGHDFLEWQRQLGSGVSAVTSSAAVPEPPMLLLAATIALVAGPKGVRHARNFLR